MTTHKHHDHHEKHDNHEPVRTPAMSVLNYYAGLAMQGILAGSTRGYIGTPAEIAKAARAIAEAMVGEMSQ